MCARLIRTTISASSNARFDLSVLKGMVRGPSYKSILLMSNEERSPSSQMRTPEVRKCSSSAIVFVHTPLHAVIASQFLRHLDGEIIIVAIGNDLLQTYCDRYFSNYEVKFVRRGGILKTLWTLGRIEWRLRKVKHDFYSGSLKLIFSRLHLLISGGMQSLNSYDDGYGNIAGKGYFYEDDKGLKRLLFNIFFREYKYKKIVKKINRHYTIFNCVNAYSECASDICYIPLSFSRIHLEGCKNPTALLITQPFSEHGVLSPAREKELYASISNKYGVQYRLPHPGEDVSKDKSFSFVKTIRGDFIAEEYIASLSERVKNVSLYGVNSTVLFTVANIAGVRCVSIKIEGVPPIEIPPGYEAIQVASI